MAHERPIDNPSRLMMLKVLFLANPRKMILK